TAPDARDRSHTHPSRPSRSEIQSSACRLRESRVSFGPPISEATHHTSSKHCFPSQTHKPSAEGRPRRCCSLSPCLSDKTQKTDTQSESGRTAKSSHQTSHRPDDPPPSAPIRHASRAQPPAYSPRPD